ncbi:MAG: hypothetical protein RL699_1390 [Bacteroidota bacterium]|jgi:6-phosphogluconolactonase
MNSIKIDTKLLLVLLLFGICSAQQTNFLIGSYTSTPEQGISLVNWDAKANKLSLQQTILGIENPSFVITNRAKTMLVCVEEIGGEQGGKISSFQFDAPSNTFRKQSTAFTQGNDPCTLAFSPDETKILVGNYSGGSLAVFPIDLQGKLGAATQFVAYSGNSVNTQRQEKPHVHCLKFHPNSNHLFVTDLGTDEIKVIPYTDTSDNFLQLEATQIVKVPAGSGPRHLVFSADGSRLFVNFELTNELAVYACSGNQLVLLQTLPLSAPTKQGSAAELRLSADEKFLYASVRGQDNQLVVFQKNNVGDWIKIQSIPTALTPRNFILTPNQEYVLVASQGSNLLSVYNRNKKTGLLTPNSAELAIYKPVYFYPF